MPPFRFEVTNIKDITNSDGLVYQEIYITPKSIQNIKWSSLDSLILTDKENIIPVDNEITEKIKIISKLIYNIYEHDTSLLTKLENPENPCENYVILRDFFFLVLIFILYILI